MKTLAFCAGLVVAMSVNAQPPARATLVGRHMTRSIADAPMLICEYVGSSAKFEILSQNGKCAPYIDVQ